MLNIPPKILIAAIAFLLLWGLLATTVPSLEIAVVLGILLLTIFLFAFEVVGVGVDVAAVTVMVVLGLLSSFNDLLGLAPGTHA